MTSDIRFNISKPEMYYEDGEEICEWKITESENRCSCSVYYYTHEPEKVYIANVKTQPEYRRQGLATKMFEAVFVYIKALQQFSTVFLWVDDDSWMKQWYFRLGFKYLNTCIINPIRTTFGYTFHWNAPINKVGNISKHITFDLCPAYLTIRIRKQAYLRITVKRFNKNCRVSMNFMS